MNDKILKLLAHNEYAPSNVPELIELLGLPRNQQQSLQKALRSLEQTGQILRTKGNRYILASEAGLVPGVIQITRQGRGFVQPDEAGLTEISISESSTSTALHGDRVLVRRDQPRSGKSPHAEPESTGSVVRILERQRTQFVGTLKASKQFLYVTPDDPRISHDIYVPPPKDVGRVANLGDKVVVELLQWESRHSNPEGQITEVLGPADEEGVDMLSVLRHYDLPLSFPKPVLKEAQSIVASRSLSDASPADLEGRIDCRKHAVVTIDPDDAKDFDDAIYLEPHSGDRIKLWVHIADVSHYVTPGSALDVEARKRGNSTYLVDRVIPMLPEALSNELCSLKPDVDRLTKCVEFIIDGGGNVISSKFYPSVIRSKRRFTYKEVFGCLQRSPADSIERMVHQAHIIAQKIRSNRFKVGSLNLDFPESKIRLDEHGKVKLIERIENDVSHQLIEEFMLLANEAVAGRLMNLNRPAVYRIHESPKASRLSDYRDEVLSHRIPCGDLTVRGEVQKLLSRLGTEPIGAALRIGFLKSLMRARYSIDPLGHYGLAKTKYTHFTSPIRRYADLVVHRALFDRKESSHASLNEIANHISVTERTSADAERASKDVKLYAYLSAQLKSRKPQVYRGLVTDVRNFVFFVDVPDLGMSGGVPLSSIKDDFFVYDPQRRELYGRRTRQTIRLGDEVMVQVLKVDDAKKQVDFQLAPSPRPTGSDRRRPAPPREQGDKRPAPHPARQSKKQSRPSVDKGKPSRGVKPAPRKKRR